jgi:dTDP-glucose 4,6-dehydratase
MDSPLRQAFESIKQDITSLKEEIRELKDLFSNQEHKKGKKILITGGCGFIGSNFIEYLLTSDEIKEELQIVNIDKLTYAGRGKNIEHLKLDNHPNYKLIKGDISDKSFVEKVCEIERPEIIFNFAAESHVDRSIESSEDFVLTNIIGTTNLLDASVKNKIKLFFQVSTDEVYGSIKKGSFSEVSKLHPSSPYSSSKAAAELIAVSYAQTHKLPIIITRSANNYGPYQFPEKLLPRFITNLIEGKKVPLMWSDENPGLNVRDWLHVKDNCRAIWFLSQKGKTGEIYNISGENEKTNIDMTLRLLSCFNYGEEMIEKVTHRKAHDFRYSITNAKLKKLGFKYKYKNLDKELKELVEWHKTNEDWWASLK